MKPGDSHVNQVVSISHEIYKCFDKSHEVKSKIDRGFVTFLMVNLKMFTTGEYYGLPKCIIAHNLDEEIHFQLKERQFFFGLPVPKIIMGLSGENCGLPRPHGFPYTLVCNFSNSKTCYNKFFIPS